VAHAAMDRNRTCEKLSEQKKALMAEVESLLGRAEAADKKKMLDSVMTPATACKRSRRPKNVWP